MLRRNGFEDSLSPPYLLSQFPHLHSLKFNVNPSLSEVVLSGTMSPFMVPQILLPLVHLDLCTCCSR